MKKYKYFRFLALLIGIMAIGGCSSFGKGVVQGFLDKPEEKDTRACQVRSKGFSGLDISLDRKEGKTKVLMVHGVGHHIPGYSTILLEKLAKELNLPVMESPYKELTLTDIDSPSKNLGNLRLNRLLSKDRSRELLFYELTWSSISQSEKEVLAYDNSGEYSFRRAKVNDILKKFSNDAIADPMIYLGDKQEDIQKSVTESSCWMSAHGWSDFPSGAHKPCNGFTPAALANTEKDELIFITHSLGSRITIDALQRTARLINDKKIREAYPNLEKLHRLIQDKEVTIFMLSNQLPLLQLGRSLPKVVNEHKKYCSAQGSHYSERFANQTHIVAFSDPNDILSYTIPESFKDKYLDSRMCTTVSNVILNVANVVDVLGFGIANPMEAHLGYDHDERVVALIAHGVSNQNMAPLIKERCNWTELTH